MVRASEEVKAPAKAAKERQRGISVLERLREQERIEAEKDAAKSERKEERDSGYRFVICGLCAAAQHQCSTPV